MKVYLINLDRSPERLAHMQALLDGLGIAFERIPAVDGRTLTADDLAGAGPSMSRGEIGCFLSHLQAWSLIAAGREPFSAVVEDDIHIAPALGAFIRDADWIPPDADIVKLETMLRPIAMDRSAIQVASGHELRRLRSTHSGTAGYIISAKTARSLSARCTVPDRPVDALLFEFLDGTQHDLTVYQMNPALLVQHDHAASGIADPALASEIGSERAALRRTAKTPWTRLAREVRKGIARLGRHGRDHRAGLIRTTIPFAGSM